MIKAYKGFNKDLQCAPNHKTFQYELGKEYEEESAETCCSGFHSCENPLDVFFYYPPTDSRYCEVEADGDISKDDDDSKIASTKIKIGAEIGLKGLIEAGVKFILDRVDFKSSAATNASDYSAATNTGNCSAATNTGYCSVAANVGNCSVAANVGNYSAATNTGDCSVAANVGNCSAATNTGGCSAATNTGGRSAATNTGNCSAATNTGGRSAATNTGCCSAATNTGRRSAATSTGYCSAATNTGDYSTATSTGDCSAATNTGSHSAATKTGDYSTATVEGKESVAFCTGAEGKAKGALGCWLVLAEWAKTTDRYHLVNVKAHKVDGKVVKPDTFYVLENGKFKEVKEAK